jgi:peptidoglycan/xylan/chitin deacetylase (PgdA/CDA1 family)
VSAYGIKLHYFHGQSYPARPGSISREELIKIIDRNRILPARQWLERAIGNALRPGDICLTFDANLRCQTDIALPVLKSYGLTAFWFICTSPLAGNIEPLEIDRLFCATQFASEQEFHAAFFAALEASEHWPLAQVLLEERLFHADKDRKFHFVRDQVLGARRYRALMDQMIADAGFDVREAAKNLWMSDADIRALHAAGHVIGLHSHTNPLKLADLDEDAQRDEYFENYAYVYNLLDERPLAMSHPENSYNEITLNVLRELGIRVGFAGDDEQPVRSYLEFPRIYPSSRACRLAA